MRVSTCPTTIKPLLARVKATFILRSLAKNPMLQFTLQRTVQKTTTSASRPWNESMVATVTELIVFESTCFSRFWRSFDCAVYGVRTAIDMAGGSSELELGMCARADGSR